MSRQLFEESDDSESNSKFQLDTNEKYAKNYNNIRRKELLQKFKGKDGGTISSSDSSSDSSEDENISNATFDQEFFKTLALLKSNNPKIYDKNINFFCHEPNKNARKSDDKFKPLTLKDYERQVILGKGGKFEDDSNDDEDNKGKEGDRRMMSPSKAEEEKLLKEEFRRVIKSSEDTSCDEEFGGIFKKRTKTKEEARKEEDDYLSWLAGKQETITDSIKEQLEPLKSYWNDSNLSKSEQFLRDYILNKGYAEASHNDKIPTYDEIIADKNIPLEEDANELDKQEEFEHKYNFRFEEPDQEFIKRYPRIIGNSVRRTDDKRKQKRQEIKERKQREKKLKLKELEVIKEMKRKEIEEKIHKLKLVTGNDELAFNENEFDEEFDPETHDKRMQEIFNDNYYQMHEDEKPECPSDIEDLKIVDWDSYNPNKSNINEVTYNEDYTYNEQDDDDGEDFNMDCDYDPHQAKKQLQQELIHNTRGQRRRRKGRRNRFMDMIKSEKPAFNPDDEKTYAEYIDEYYKLDCEDIIDDIPCRFKYVETTPNDFGLTIEEILMAKNKELNQWASLKKAIQIRPDYLEKKDQRLYKLKANNMELKRKIFKSIYGNGSDDEEKEENVEEKIRNESLINMQKDNLSDYLDKNHPKKRKNDDNKINNAQQQHGNNKALKIKENYPNDKYIKLKTKIENSLLRRQTSHQNAKGGLQNVKKKDIKVGKVRETQNATPKALDGIIKDNLHKQSIPLKQRNKKKSKQSVETTKITLERTGQEVSDERLKAYGINPKKFHKILHFKKKRASLIKKTKNSFSET